MAVYDILPSTNLRAVDIRDTLLANGANWSTSPIKNANYLPNYFRKEANINMWSRYKPVVSNILTTMDDDDYIKANFGLTIFKSSGYGYKELFDKIEEINSAIIYEIPETKLRLGDFRGYDAQAISPTEIDQVKEVKKGSAMDGENYVTTFRTFVNHFSSNIKFEELYGSDFRDIHYGVIIKTQDYFFWGNADFNWNEFGLRPVVGEAKILHILSSEPVIYTEAPSRDAVIYAVGNVDNYYDCIITNDYGTGSLEFRGWIVNVAKSNDRVNYTFEITSDGDIYRGGWARNILMVIKEVVGGVEENPTLGTDSYPDYFSAKGTSKRFNGSMILPFNAEEGDSYDLELWIGGKMVSRYSL